MNNKVRENIEKIAQTYGIWIFYEQKLSEEFIGKFSDKVDIKYLLINDNIDNKIKKN